MVKFQKREKVIKMTEQEKYMKEALKEAQKAYKKLLKKQLYILIEVHNLHQNLTEIYWNILELLNQCHYRQVRGIMQ